MSYASCFSITTGELVVVLGAIFLQPSKTGFNALLTSGSILFQSSDNVTRADAILTTTDKMSFSLFKFVMVFFLLDLCPNYPINSRKNLCIQNALEIFHNSAKFHSIFVIHLC